MSRSPQTGGRENIARIFYGNLASPPELVLEIVSNTVGEEDSQKQYTYAQIRINDYVMYDPLRQVMSDVLTVYRLRDFGYERQESTQFPMLTLGLTLWEGQFEVKHDTWLRWTDEHGGLIPTGKERAEHTEQRAEHVEQLLAQERQRAERLAVLLHQAGIDPEEV